MCILQFELLRVHAQVQWNYCFWWNVWWEGVSISECNGDSLWFAIFLVKLVDREMVEAGRKFDQDIAEVDICHSILAMKIQNQRIAKNLHGRIRTNAYGQ